MLDRESTFANPIIIQSLKEDFIPVAIDQAYQRRQKDTEGDFYRKIAGKSPRGDGSNGGTTQGLYVAAPDGTFLGYSNHRDPERILLMLGISAAKYIKRSTPPIKPTKLDPRYNPQPPKNGVVVRVQAKVLSGYPATNNKWTKIFQSALSRDNLWITDSEKTALSKGVIPGKLQKRIAKYHLVDNTRGEPPMWRENEIRSIEMKIRDGKLTGSVLLETGDGKRGYDCQLTGIVKTEGNRIKQFDVVARGQFWGHGPYTRNPPPGKFPLAISFTLADGSDIADKIPPQGSRGWVAGYLR